MILRHNHRQGNDKTWSETLNHLREGIVLEEDETVLKSLVTSHPMQDESSLHIFYYNEHVLSHNGAILSSLHGEFIECEAIQAVPKGCKSLTNIKKGTIGQTNFHEKLKFKIGARCSLVYNINVMDDLYNGASGLESNLRKAKSIVLSFDLMRDLLEKFIGKSTLT